MKALRRAERVGIDADEGGADVALADGLGDELLDHRTRLHSLRVLVENAGREQTVS